MNYFGNKKITDRYKYIYDKMDAYIRARELEDQLEIHEGILQQVVMDYFVDIYRMKEFHKIDHAGTTKIIAYEAYWILRRKPLQPCEGALDSKAGKVLEELEEDGDNRVLCEKILKKMIIL